MQVVKNVLLLLINKEPIFEEKIMYILQTLVFSTVFIQIDLFFSFPSHIFQ